MMLANAPATGDDGPWTALGTEAFNEKIRDTFNSRCRHGADNLDSDRRTGGLRGVLRSRAQGLRPGHDRLCRDRAQGGNQSTPAPVWFTMSADRAQLLIQAHKGSWKDKRIRRGSPVIVWIGGLNGPSFVGKAEITKDAAVVGKIRTDYPKKYGSVATLKMVTEEAPSGTGRRGFRRPDRTAGR